MEPEDMSYALGYVSLRETGISVVRVTEAGNTWAFSCLMAVEGIHADHEMHNSDEDGPE